MTMRALVNIAVSLALTLLLIFVLRGFAGLIFSEPPAPAAQEAAAPAKPAGTEKTGAAKPSEPAKTETRQAEAKPAETKPAETKPAGQAKPAEETKTAEAPAAPAAAGAGDPAAGAKVFKKCKACHYADKEKNKVGPYLKGVVGRKTASVEGFRYSDAMKAKGAEGLVWTEENLKKYLADPKGFVPKNKMSFGGLKKPADIANIIAYLKTAK